MNYQYSNPLEEAKIFFKRNKVFARILIINVAVFLAVNLINLFLRLSKAYSPMELSPVIEWLSVPASLGALIQRPWTIISYMFLQSNFFHLFFNMIVFYFGGRIFLEYMSQKKLLNVYLWGGIAGAVLYIAFFNIFPLLRESVGNSIALGSSASVLAILIAIATYVPNYTVNLMFFGRVKLKYIAIVIVLIDVLSIFTITTRDPGEINFGGHIAHLGGALWGYLNIKIFMKGYANNQFFHIFDFSKIFSSFLKPKKTKTRSKANSQGRPMTDDEYNLRKADKQKKIDAILEKISRSGYESLSKEEKEFLFRMSNKN